MDESKVDVFDPASMEVKYEVGGKILTLRPLKWGSFKKLMKLTNDQGLDQGDQIFSILKLLFPGQDHDFLTQEFFDNELTLRLSGEIVREAIKINGLGGSKDNVIKG